MFSLVPIVVVFIVLFFAVLVIGLSSIKRKDSGKGKKLKTRDRNQILKEANRRLATNPKDCEALTAIGDLAWSDQDWEKAFKSYEVLAEAVAGNPDLDEFTANLRLGMSALRLNRLEDAYKGLSVARTIKQDSFEVNFNLGYLEYQRRQYEKAVALLKNAAGQNTEHSLCLRYLGHSYFKMKQYKEAVGALRRAIDLEPDDKESLFALAECYYELGNLEQSLKLFSHLRTDPQLGPQAALFAGTVHLNQHQYDKAILDFEIGLKHQELKIETTTELKYRLAAAYLKMQEIGKAVTLLTEVQGIYPNYKDVPALLGKFKELNTSRNLQVYLLGSTSEFVTLCRKIVLMFFPKAKVKITDISVNKNDWADVLAEIETTKWSDLVLFRFIRSSGVMGELLVRDFHARTKDLKAGKGFCVSAGTYTDEAKRFVEARLIDLIEKPELLGLLNTIDSRTRRLMDSD